MPSPKPLILTQPDASPLERFAAEELRRYLMLLWRLDVPISTRHAGAEYTHRFVLCDPARIERLPQLSQQGHAVWRTSPDTIALAGGSPSAVVWAVYELLERYGVRYLLHDDVVPAPGMTFHLPDVRVVCEPVQRLRCWRQFNELATGPVIWSLDQQKRFISQLFKLKFNGVYLSLWPHQPAVDFEVSGIRRTTSELLFGQKFRVDRDTIGFEHLWKGELLDNPELAGLVTSAERTAALQRLLHGILAHARSLGMYTAVAVNALEFPKEFKPLLESPTDHPIQLGDLTCAERGNLLNPGHVALVGANLRAYLEQYPEVDEILIHTPEHPHADGLYRDCWNDLSQRFNLGKRMALDDLIEAGRTRSLAPDGAARGEREVKSAISMLHFVESFVSASGLLTVAEANKTKLGLSLGAGFADLLPVLPLVLWPGAAATINLGYTASRAVRRISSMRSVDAGQIDLSLILTLQDDNVGSLPQVATPQLRLLLNETRHLGWRGYFTRYWPIGDLDPVVAYLSRASWNAHTSPAESYRDHFAHAYGSDDVERFLSAMQLLEDATLILDLNFLGLFFPATKSFHRFIDARKPMAEGLFHVRANYAQAKELLDRVQIPSDRPNAHQRMNYLRARLEFSIEAINEVEVLCDAGIRMDQSGIVDAAHLLTRAADAGRRALRAAAANVRDDSDRGTLATYYQLMVRDIEQYGRAEQDWK